MIDFIKALFVSILQFFNPPAPAEIVDVPVIQRPAEPATIQELVYDEEQAHCAALNIYFEARNQDPQGKVAVSHVVFNRAKDEFWPGNICDVVKQGSYTTGRVRKNQCQFSWFCDGLSDRPFEPTTWDNAVHVARYAYYIWSIGHDITEGATNYHSVNVDPTWRQDRGMKYIKTIDDHLFYYWERNNVSVASK